MIVDQVAVKLVAQEVWPTLYIGIDPSYSKTGLAIISIGSKTSLNKIDFYALSPSGVNATYADAVYRARSILIDILTYINESDDKVSVIMEEPLLSSIKASRLGILSGILVSGLLSEEKVESIYTIPPYYVASLNNKVAKDNSLNKKQASLLIVGKILDKLKEHGFSVVIHNDKFKKDGSVKPRQLSHDEAEAFLMLLVLLKSKNLIDDNMMQALIELNPKFKKDQEIITIKE
jgi:Holliday junction resolvasome RuvABC endonuclease subunit